jgi:branched-chain amino acid transport system substrate-binding protein
MMFWRGLWFAGALVVALPAHAAEPGITAAEVRIGQTNPYSGPNSAYGSNGTADTAYFKMINDRGGVNGRKITLLSLDDSYSPPRAVEQTRRLVEQEEVALIYRSLGTASNMAVAKYLNSRKVPALLLGTGSSDFNNPAGLPWSMGSLNYPTEAAIYARYILANKPDARIAVLYQNDDLGKDFLKGLKTGLGDAAARMIVKEASFEVTDPTVSSQIIDMQGSGADVFFNFASVKVASQAIGKAYDIGWHPLQFLPSISSFIGIVLRPAGLDKSLGVVTANFVKDPADPMWRDDPDVAAWNAWMDKYLPDGDRTNMINVNAWIFGAIMVQVLTQCGDDLSRDNILRQASNLHGFRAPMMLPGITVDTSPRDRRVIKQLQLERFDGTRWVTFGGVLGD